MAYADGAFPMAEEGHLQFFHCDPRSVLEFNSFHVPKRLARIVKKAPFRITVDRAFERVVRGCRADRPEWISEELVQLYLELHREGFAHSIEAWQGEQLAGGIYGMALGSAFMAESMFHNVTHASNVCLVELMQTLKACEFDFCDIQYANEHTVRFGPETIPLETFKDRLNRAILKPTRFQRP